MECIEHVGWKDKDGYGMKRINKKCIRAHRIAYCKHNNIDLDDISGFVIMHKCDNRACINPDHLQIGTQRDNVIDMDNKNRRKNRYKEENKSSKLNTLKVMEIRDKYSYRSYTLQMLAMEYDVTFSTIHKIVKNKTWTQGD